MSATPAQTLFFMHVRKTGGTTLGRALGNRFAAADCLSLYDRPKPGDLHLDHYRYVTGHLDISFLDRFRRRPYVVACLREPIERALSVYSYYRRFPPDQYEILLPQLGPAAYERRVAAMSLARELPLEEFLQRKPELAVEHLGNVQTRTLCGSSVEGSGEDLDLALGRLRSLDFIALTERLDESAVWLARRLGWRELGPLPRANVTEDRLTRDRISPRALDTLRELTALDAELYRIGAREYERQIAGWSREAVPSDPAADLPDAPTVSDLRFSEPVAGAGWWGRERVESTDWFCWIGDTRRAWVDLKPLPVSSRLVVEIEHVIEQQALDGLTIRADGEVVAHELRNQDAGLVATAPLPAAAGVDPALHLELEVETAVPPSDIDPASNDTRALSVAVRRIALESLI